MQTNIIIYLHAEDLLHPSWSVFDEKEQCIEEVTRAPGTQLSKWAEASRITVIVPGEEVLLNSIDLPKMRYARLLEALPFALEENLIDEPEQLHIVPCVYTADGQCTLLIVAHEKLKQWQAVLQNFSIAAHIMIPDYLAVASVEQAWVMVMYRKRAIVRLDACRGFSVELDNLAFCLEAAAETWGKPVRILIEYAEPVPNALTYLPLQNNADIAIEVQSSTPDYKKTTPSNFVKDAKLAERKPVYNLLQGGYRVKNLRWRWRDAHKIWRISAAMLVAWSSLLLAYPIISYSILKYRIMATHNRIEKLGNQYFPEKKNTDFSPTFIQQQIADYKDELNKNRLLVLLSAIGQGLMRTPQVQLSSLDYSGDQLMLSLSALNVEQLNQFIDFLNQQKLSVKQQNTEFVANRVSSTFLIEKVA